MPRWTRARRSPTTSATASPSATTSIPTTSARSSICNAVVEFQRFVNLMGGIRDVRVGDRHRHPARRRGRRLQHHDDRGQGAHQGDRHPQGARRDALVGHAARARGGGAGHRGGRLLRPGGRRGGAGDHVAQPEGVGFLPQPGGGSRSGGLRHRAAGPRRRRSPASSRRAGRRPSVRSKPCATSRRAR